ncbi:phosphoribosylformylglycinamidine synthase subunit PurQ [Phycisphaera mikurensis]|uniref:Phosphoribosylformylglycinamidine synthase I n=1 Tax=Phycisphaera mikurensis (strain NBRC 102666 / KCTC 22515 / FYK2301M01) TaxID=1142394 RepID=I0IFY4_PHYMF|nr:phosphoribosylformylglycinamidine synthase subunit PurQ [Phycisphaera mikurensis]MBB6440442.1 phosphoribosylformylglycinamidine synthase [Phycisphaera mikurensis]BAM04172.1 phosphoribosylformylglycinamidine synthase I [Phycisphaera mikurensis NBRC 102666]
MASPSVLILRTAGTNCDAEMAHAFSLAGFTPETVHVNALAGEPGRLAGFAALGLPGGFSHGDDIAAGRILAARLRQDLLPALQENIERGMLVLGVCNGFQVLVKLGLLPDPVAAVQITTLARNRSGIFHDAWHHVAADEESPCVWTRGLGEHELPSAHAEGRFTAPAAVLDALEENHQVALRYAGESPSGSDRGIAGICDPTGRVFGLMPHPERWTDPLHHPAWTSGKQDPAGLRYFRNARDAV